MLLYSAFFVALVITMALIPPLMRVASRLALVDTPNERKVHTTTIPRIGGMAMVVGACIPILLWFPHTATVTAFLSALLVLLIFGAWDDRNELGYHAKFLGQSLAVFLVVFWGGVSIRVFPFMGMDQVPAYMSIPVTVLFLVGVTNAVNLADGLDGLAGGVTLLSLGAVALLAKLAGGTDLVMICFVIAGTIFGFLRYNTFPARIFMGDTGSQFLGFTVGVLAVMLTQQVSSALNPWLPLFLVGLPIVDTLSVMVLRISARRSPFAADKNHMHHRLLNFGLAHYEAVAVIYVTQLAFLVVAFLVRYQSDLVVFAAYTGLVGLILGGMQLLQSRGPSRRLMPITSQVVRFHQSEQIRTYVLRAMCCGIPAYLLLGVLLVTDVPTDIAVSSLILLVILLIRLIWSEDLRYVSLRLLIFPTIAFAVYLMHSESLVDEVVSLDFKIGLLIVLLALMLIVIRTTKNQIFQTTPTDLLVIALTGGAGVLYQQGMIKEALVPAVVGAVVLFYAAELIMRHMQQTWNCFTFGMVAVLTVLSFRLY